MAVAPVPMTADAVPDRSGCRDSARAEALEITVASTAVTTVP